LLADPLSFPAMQPVAALLAAHAPSLRVVVLRENELGDRGAITLSRALAALAAPLSVDLVGNQVRVYGHDRVRVHAESCLCAVRMSGWA
jgi:hypothetical protein